MGYKRMTKTRVKLMHAIGRQHRLSPISLGGEKQIATTTLKITGEDVHNNPTLEQTRAKKIHLRQHTTHTIKSQLPHGHNHTDQPVTSLVVLPWFLRELTNYASITTTSRLDTSFNATVLQQESLTFTALPHILTI
jgi:hypothetical protein